MKRKSVTSLVAVLLATSMLCTSCIGSFSLTNKLLDWNRNIDSKFVNELVFVALGVIQVYSVSLLADILVINSIEFWSGDNPIADASVKTIETEKGTIAIETNADGYQISNDEQNIELVYDKNDNSWSVEAEGESHKLLQFQDNDKVVMYLPDGQTMQLSTDEAGLLAFRQVAAGFSYYASK